MSTDLKAFDFTSLFQKSLPSPTEDEVLPEGVNHGWYSAKMAEKCSTIVYKSEDGSSELTVTNITSTAKHGLGYDDVVYVGRIYIGVGGFVRSYEKPNPEYFTHEYERDFVSHEQEIGPVKELLFDSTQFNFPNLALSEEK